MEEINIHCENGCLIRLIDFEYIDEYYISKILIKSSWFEAKSKIRFSPKKFQLLKTNLTSLLSNVINDLSFIDDSGHFEINFSTDNFSNKIDLSGELHYDLLDESKIEYYMVSNISDLNLFLNDFIRVLSLLESSS